ncbi:MAG: RNA polymerase sigma factor [Candidatus Doudnabacteria bacterium]|nr:RNA polymerase sigma factor [Candidatus Doudnabacteria bacterium]
MSNEEVYTNLVNTHLDEIYNFSYHMLFDHEEAQDVAQKTFIALHKNIIKLDLNFPVRAWLFRVARNNCLDAIKRKKALLFSDLEEESLEVPSEDPGLETKLDDVLFLESFKEQLKDLPANVREIMVMKYYEDLTFEEISDILARPLNTVKSQFYRGKIRLYKIIKGL